MAVAVAGGGLAHEVFVGSIAAQAPVAAGATVGDGLGREQTGLGSGLGQAGPPKVGVREAMARPGHRARTRVRLPASTRTLVPGETPVRGLSMAPLLTRCGPSQVY